MLAIVYLIGSLRNPLVPEVAKAIREATNDEVFDDWYAAGPEADDYWRDYERGRGHSYSDALRGFAAKHVFDFDKFHLDRADVGVLMLPAGKSGHLELGYLSGRGASTYILLDKEPERFDVMYQFANRGVYTTLDDLLKEMLLGRQLGVEAHSTIVPRHCKATFSGLYPNY